MAVLRFSVFLTTIVPAVAMAEYRLNFQEPVTDIAREQYNLHLIVLWLSVVIGVGVFAVMFYSIFKHRKSVGHQAAQFHDSTVVEIIWTIVPFLIILALAFPATRSVLAYKDSSNSDLTIKVVGHQWKWSYDYLERDVAFYSTLSTPPEQIGPLLYGASGTSDLVKNENYLLEVDRPMVVPVNRKVRLLFTAGDVIHSWWVPQLGVKQDAIPGLVREAWFAADRIGTYRGQCAELCGKNHGFMPIVVEVVSVEDYEAWFVANASDSASGELKPSLVGEAAVAPAPAGDTTATATEWEQGPVMAFGKKVYWKVHCVACHGASGEGIPPAFPALVGSAIVTGPVAEHIKMVLHGVTGTAMASFAHLSNEEIAALITYERNAWGNDSGDLITPEQVSGAR